MKLLPLLEVPDDDLKVYSGFRDEGLWFRDKGASNFLEEVGGNQFVI